MDRETNLSGRVVKAEFRYLPTELPIEVKDIMKLTGGRPLDIDVELVGGGRIHLQLMKTPFVHQMNGRFAIKISEHRIEEGGES